MDSHSSHFQPEIVEFVQTYGIIIFVCLPILDAKSWKLYWKAPCHTFIQANPHQQIVLAFVVPIQPNCNISTDNPNSSDKNKGINEVKRSPISSGFNNTCSGYILVGWTEGYGGTTNGGS